jgi:hypothetical protein
VIGGRNLHVRSGGKGHSYEHSHRNPETKSKQNDSFDFQTTEERVREKEKNPKIIFVLKNVSFESAGKTRKKEK